MGTKLDFTNHIDISKNAADNGLQMTYGYHDLTDQFISQLIKSPTIKYVQISEALPPQAYIAIDKIFEKRDDLHFRIYGLNGHLRFDLTCLHLLTHLRHLTLDVHLRDRQNMLDLRVITELKNLQTLRLSLFDLIDYGFIMNLPTNIEELCISADTMGRSVLFDCSWLKRYKRLKTLYLGKRAKKHIECIAEIESLENLTLRGIKLKGFEFLCDNELRTLSIHLCGMNDLTSLTGFGSLRSLELWRITNLKDISFISSLTGLERISFRDLRHITALPDLSALKNLHEILVDNVPIDAASLPVELQKITRIYR